MKKAMVFFCFVLAVALLVNADASAGQFTTVPSVPNGGEVAFTSSPKNYGNAMEMHVYEWPSTTVTDNYRCRIVSNSTGRALRLRLIGVDGSIINFCITPVNGTCATPIVSLLPNLKFHCTVSSGNPFPVTSSALYRVAIGRP